MRAGQEGMWLCVLMAQGAEAEACRVYVEIFLIRGKAQRCDKVMYQESLEVASKASPTTSWKVVVEELRKSWPLVIGWQLGVPGKGLSHAR